MFHEIGTRHFDYVRCGVEFPTGLNMKYTALLLLVFLCFSKLLSNFSSPVVILNTYLKCVGVGFAVTLHNILTVSCRPTYIPRILRVEQNGLTKRE